MRKIPKRAWLVLPVGRKKRKRRQKANWRHPTLVEARAPPLSEYLENVILPKKLLLAKNTSTLFMKCLNHSLRAGSLVWLGHLEGPKTAFTRLRSQVQVLPGPPFLRGRSWPPSVSFRLPFQYERFSGYSSSWHSTHQHSFLGLSA